MAKRIVLHASEVFVRFSAATSLSCKMMRNCVLEEKMPVKDPDHWARLFGQHVEAAT